MDVLGAGPMTRFAREFAVGLDAPTIGFVFASKVADVPVRTSLPIELPSGQPPGVQADGLIWRRPRSARGSIVPLHKGTDDLWYHPPGYFIRMECADWLCRPRGTTRTKGQTICGTTRQAILSGWNMQIGCPPREGPSAQRDRHLVCTDPSLSSFRAHPVLRKPDEEAGAGWKSLGPIMKIRVTTRSWRRIWGCLGACTVMFTPWAQAGAAAEAHDSASQAPESVAVDPRKVRFEFPFSTYRQEVTIVFASEAFAEAAVITPTPLWDGREWAVSSRWDDTVPENLRMREFLTAHGHRGTFYLNAWFKNWSDLTTTPDSPYARALLQGGHSLGGHSLSHPWLSYCHRNRIFEEVAGIRMVWEAATDTPLNSYAFSYCDFRNEDEGDFVQTDIVRALERAGFYHVANEPTFENLPSDLILSPILPADGASIEEAAEGFFADPAYRAAHPILTYSMHAVYDSPAEWAGFERDLERFGHRPDWWYCHQTEYAAYRYQYLHTQVRSELRGDALLPGGTLSSDQVDTNEPQQNPERSRTRTLVLERPVLLDLNDPVPLTFEVVGVPRDAVKQVICASATCQPSERSGSNFRFHLYHDSDQALPSIITLVPPNTTNSALEPASSAQRELPGISAHLYSKRGLLRLRLVNRSSVPLTACRVIYRLPLAWNSGVVQRNLPNLTPKNGVEDFYRLPAANEDYKYSAGNAFLAAQIDFRLGDRQARVHTACYLANNIPDPSFPQSGFVRIGPFSRDQVDLPKLMTDLREGVTGAHTWELADGSLRVWEVADDPFLPPHFDAERVRLSGAWSGWNHLGYYVLHSRVWSDTDRIARLQTTGGNFAAGIVLNGDDVTGCDRVHLVAGENPLTLVCSALPAVFLRLEDPDSGERLSDIHYEIPELPSLGALPYPVPSRGTGGSPTY